MLKVSQAHKDESAIVLWLPDELLEILP